MKFNYFLFFSLVLFGCNQETISRGGFPCTLTQQTDGVLIQCNDGTEGFVANGNNGTQGPQGPQGLPGTSTQLVQLCPGDTAVYPEQGIKVGSNLYAVYWSPSVGAFLAFLLPNTTYVTTNGSGCLFKVNADGTTSAI